MGNKRYTDADVIAVIKKATEKTSIRQVALEHKSTQNLTLLFQGKRPLDHTLAKSFGFTLHHFYTKDTAARLVFPNPPKIKKGGKYSRDEFLSIMVHMIGDVPHRTVSTELGFAPSYINRLLEKVGPPPAPIAKAFGFTRIKTGHKTYIFVKD